MELIIKYMINNYNIINIPYNTKIIIWTKYKKDENTKIYLISPIKTFKLDLKNIKKLTIDKWVNSIIIKKKNYNSIIKLNNLINIFLYSWSIYFFNKIKFKGKGFRLKFFKKLKIIKFFFGKSHKTFLLLKKIKKFRINKYKFILIGLKKTKLNRIKFIINKIKNINIYTLRGLRFSRQIIFKRKGKKGTYI